MKPRPANEPKPVGNTSSLTGRPVSPRDLINIERGPSLFAILAPPLLLALFMVIVAYVFGGA